MILQNDDYNNREALLERFDAAKADICAATENRWEQVHIARGIAVYDPDTDTFGALGHGVNDPGGDLLQLRRENRLYKLAAGLMIADLVIGSIRSDYVAYYLRFLFSGHYELTLAVFRIISYIPLACSLGALAAEYMAHRRLVKPYDAKLSQRWFQLMIAGLAVSALASIIGSILASLIENGTLSIMIYQNYIFPLLRLPGIAISVLYMICLYKTERKLR